MKTTEQSLDNSKSSSLRDALLLAAGLILLHMPAGLPAPLYPLYQDTMGIGPGIVSMLFASYIAGTIIGLVLMPTAVRSRYGLIWACLLSIIGDFLFILATGALGLFVAHILQGIVLGIFTGAVPAALAKLDLAQLGKAVGRITTSANAIGLAVSPLWSGLLLQFAPWPGELVWVIQIVATLIVAPFLRLPSHVNTPTDSVSVRGILATIRRGRSMPASFIVGFCAFSSGALLSALGALVLRDAVHTNNGALEGFVVSICFILSAIIGAVKWRSNDLGMVRIGLLWVALGCFGLAIGAYVGILLLIILSAIACGVGQGIGLQGATEVVALEFDENSRNKAISIFFISCYVGTALAALGVGSLINATGLPMGFGGFAFLLALLGTVGIALSRTQKPYLITR
ncbi:putative MFS family arabinose efflux permease [Actinopolyspora biskrensis]|uniref:Putative MFS family arabinose efflux permease n=1 Tax=Actinopolyspora biskrensis TaxID=1470178 RepID=A0A852YQI4_9ACTN|nr:MFS transporter [Actinopolyspora biskrensis]NYH77514.1 putative MFS family arabinose efflux permease [Actinopolyspora biskrensis]